MSLIIATIFLFLFFIALVTIGVAFYAVVLFGAPFVPTKPEVVELMIRLAGVKAGEKAVDLGSGDGRMVIALARAGAEAHGFEVNPFLVWAARYSIKKAGLTGRAFIHLKSFWDADFSSYHVVTIYGFPHVMRGIERRLFKQLPAGARIVCNTFRLPEAKPLTSEGEVHVYVKN